MSANSLNPIKSLFFFTVWGLKKGKKVGEHHEEI